MNEIVKNSLWLLAGVITGATGTRLLSKNALSFRKLIVGTIAQGMSVKDKVATSFERAKENVEDLVAEAKYVQTGGSQDTEESSKTTTS
jgi:hypothetical protein